MVHKSEDCSYNQANQIYWNGFRGELAGLFCMGMLLLTVVLLWMSGKQWWTTLSNTCDLTIVRYRVFIMQQA